MKRLNIVILLICIGLLPAFADKEATSVPNKSGGANMDQFKWKKRVILSYPTNEAAWEIQQKLILQLESQIDDRDLIIIRVDSKQKRVYQFSEAQRLELINKYKLTPGSHLLIGKDGGVKKKQLGKLELQLLFKIIDQMPMRRSEMKSSKND